MPSSRSLPDYGRRVKNVIVIILGPLSALCANLAQAAQAWNAPPNILPIPLAATMPPTASAAEGAVPAAPAPPALTPAADADCATFGPIEPGAPEPDRGHWYMGSAPLAGVGRVWQQRQHALAERLSVGRSRV